MLGLGQGTGLREGRLQYDKCTDRKGCQEVFASARVWLVGYRAPFAVRIRANSGAPTAFIQSAADNDVVLQFLNSSGVALHTLVRHVYRYVVQAWSWGLLAGWPLSGNNGLAPLFYPTFLSILLIHRAIRDEEKCLAKYGSGYEEYMRLVPYKIVPFIY